MSKSKMNDAPQEMVLEDPRLFQPGADSTVQTDARPSLLGSLLEDKSSKRKSPLVEEACYSEAIAVLQGLPKSAHPVWATLKSELGKSTASQRSKASLHQKLEKACTEEELDWQEFNFIKTACQHRPKMIQLEDSAVLLYKLMGVHGSDWLFKDTEYLYSTALIKDEESASSVFLFLGLLNFVQRSICEDPSAWYPALRSKCQQMERLLEKNRGASEIRQFMKLWDKTTSNGSEDDRDEISEEDESPSQKRRCIKAEELE